MIDEDEQMYIRYSWFSYDPAVESKAKQLAELWRDDKTPLRRSKRDFGSAFNVILTAVEMLSGYDDNLLRIPRDNNLYSGAFQRNDTYTTQVKDAVVWLKEEGYLEHSRGVERTEKKKGEKRRFLPIGYKLSEKWKSEVASEPLSDKKLIRRNPLAGYVELKEKVKRKGQDPVSKIITITDSHREEFGDVIDSTNKLLAEYDEFMSGVGLSIGAKPIASIITTMTRVFNNASFEQGGRVYSEIQNQKRETRPYLYFGGEPTIEIDYSSLHPHLLYHSESLEFPGEDPYTIEGYCRDDVKIAFNVMINRSDGRDEPSAASSISYYLGCEGEEAALLEQVILALHNPIKEHFNRGEGLRLQRIDSDVAMKVIDHFVNIERRPIIGIHDSFIVSVRDTEALRLLMNDYYNALFKEQNDAVFDAIDWNGVVEGDDVDGIVGMRKVSAKALDFSEQLTQAIGKCFEGNTEGMDDKFWDELIAREPVQGEC